MTMTAMCYANQTGYSSNAACLSISAQIPAGVITDQGQNSLYCRIYHATVAVSSMTNAVTHCPHTGQAGQGVCGSNCAAYCTQYITGNCANGGATAGTTLFANEADCETKCATWSTGSMAGMNMNPVAENSLACRLYHLGVASTDATSAATHCPHAGGFALCAGTAPPSMAGGPTVAGMTKAPTPAMAPTVKSDASTVVAGVVSAAVPALMSFLL